MRTHLSSARSWGFAIGARLGRFVQLGAVLVLVFTIAACADREATDVVEEGGEAVDEQMGDQMGDQMGAAPGAEAENAVTVSITGAEIMMPASLPAGATTLTIRNSSDAPCTFAMVSGDAGGMGGAEPSPDAAGDDMMQEDETVDVEVGQTASLTVDLEPGTYVAECDGAAEAEGATERSAQVTVTDVGGTTPGAPQDGMTPQDEMNPQDGAEPEPQDGTPPQGQ